MILGRLTPDPRLGSSVKLSCRDASGLLNFVGEGLALSRKAEKDVARRIVGFDVGEEGNGARRVARGSALGQFLAIAYAQRSIDPGFLGATTVIHERFDAVPIGRPARRRGEGSWNSWPEFVGVDDRRPLA